MDPPGVEPYFRAAVAYPVIFESIVEIFSRLRESIAPEGAAPALEAETLLAADRWVAESIERHRLPAPHDAEAKPQLHLAALREWIGGMG